MCGTRLAQGCVHCGSANPLEYRYCGQCGEPFATMSGDASDAELPTRHAGVSPQEDVLAPTLPAASGYLEGERRLATVLIADVKGSTSIAEQMGSEAWVEMMNHVFQILGAEIYRLGGEVDQFRGDGLVAFFGATVSHQDDPERAVLAALAMQEAIRSYAAELSQTRGIDLRVRIGVNTGDVIVASIGDRSQHSEDTAMGRAIALAARMEAAAEPGTVLVSENTFHLVESRFCWQALGMLNVKGINKPVAVYRPLSVQRDAGRSVRQESHGPEPLLIGREEHLAVLQSCIDRLRRGEGGIALLIGNEGMGKSHVLATVIARNKVMGDLREVPEESGPLDRSQTGDLTCLHGTCRSYEQAWPYSVWLAILRQWLQIREAEPPREVALRLHRTAEALWGTALDEPYACLAHLLSLPAREGCPDDAAPFVLDGQRQRFFAAVYSWIEELAHRSPLLLILEDIHWSDATSLDLVKHCLPLCDRLPILWVMVFRQDHQSPTWRLRQHVEAEYPHRLAMLDFQPLPREQAAEMLDRLTGRGAIPDDVRALVVDRAEGNPYYIEELVRSLIHDQVLVRDEQTEKWRVVRQMDSLDLPDTLRSLLLARIDDLPPKERRVLQVASVIGTTFWKNVLSDLLRDDQDLESSILGLERAELIVDRGGVPGLGIEYAFRSALIRDAAYDSILSAQRASYHRRVADHLAQLFGEESLARYYGVIAYHYRLASEQRKELFYALSAAEHAQGICADQESINYYQRVLVLLADLADRGLARHDRPWLDWQLEALEGLGKSYARTGLLEEAGSELEQAVTLGTEMHLERSELIRLYSEWSQVVYQQGRYDRLVEIGKAGLLLIADGDAPSIERIRMLQAVSLGYLGRGDIVRARKCAARAAALITAPSPDDGALDAVLEQGPEAARRWFEAIEERAALSPV
jgi:class 3 adenylate cyclase/tetratricopeptide (TPR) repeat protein